ncbi:MAG: hypothetical protein JWL68_4299, partial [Actinomycetia bacterium]|nr:hypothetical protein [Actinomycetes bacterium]
SRASGPRPLAAPHDRGTYERGTHERGTHRPGRQDRTDRTAAEHEVGHGAKRYST